jgi:hypothetical protein
MGKLLPMTENLTRLVERTRNALRANSKHLRERVSTLQDLGLEPTTREQLCAFAGQLDDRAAQCNAWLYDVIDGLDAEREAELRDACAEWLRMLP